MGRPTIRERTTESGLPPLIRPFYRAERVQPRRQFTPVETVGLVDPLLRTFVGMGMEKTLPFIADQLFEKLPVPFFHQLIEIFKEKLVFCLLQPLPASGRLIGEGFAGSHGYIAFR